MTENALEELIRKNPNFYLKIWLEDKTDNRNGGFYGNITREVIIEALTQAKQEARQEAYKYILQCSKNLTTKSFNDELNRLTDHSLLLEKEGKIPRKLQDKNGK